MGYKSVQPKKGQSSSSIDSGPPLRPSAFAVARLSGGRGTYGTRNQARYFPGLLPVGHPLGPDQRLRGDRARGDQLAQPGLRNGALLPALGRKEPGSVGHFVALGVQWRSAGSLAEKSVVGEMERPGGGRLSNAGRSRQSFFGFACNLFVPFA